MRWSVYQSTFLGGVGRMTFGISSAPRGWRWVFGIHVSEQDTTLLQTWAFPAFHPSRQERWLLGASNPPNSLKSSGMKTKRSQIFAFGWVDVWADSTWERWGGGLNFHLVNEPEGAAAESRHLIQCRNQAWSRWWLGPHFGFKNEYLKSLLERVEKPHLAELAS